MPDGPQTAKVRRIYFGEYLFNAEENVHNTIVGIFPPIDVVLTVRFQSPVEINGQRFDLSAPKKTLVENALRKGIPRDLMEKMFNLAAILPTETETATVREY